MDGMDGMEGMEANVRLWGLWGEARVRSLAGAGLVRRGLVGALRAQGEL